MTQSHGMPDNPGDPEHTDPEATSAERAEAAAEEAERADQGSLESDIDPTLEADLEDALADIDAEVAAQAAEPTLEEQLAERTEDLQRVSAEYANYRRRTERERQVGIEAAKAQVMTQLLPILDDLDLAEKHGDLAEGPLKAFRDKFVGVVEGLKVTPFGEEGDAFDAERHEAVQDLSSGDEKVLGTVLRRGYQMGDRLLRTAMVIIADPAESAE
ncbi:molecular chaperone GrpE [Corynebacterium ulcerans]|uniref:nucleotide exchange factor GrpE n=1 Tax=Corynebacterium ulcerans TaxID=65058 RepID=UPI000C800462|nr:nucleotide exchange factor GrpE [Corynebacterium ulcerans]PME06744.1 molecular chaperone GrpE [Corynebacterium ulcerans]